jgi:hypothetical protein
MLDERPAIDSGVTGGILKHHSWKKSIKLFYKGKQKYQGLRLFV